MTKFVQTLLLSITALAALSTTVYASIAPSVIWGPHIPVQGSQYVMDQVSTLDVVDAAIKAVNDAEVQVSTTVLFTASQLSHKDIAAANHAFTKSDSTPNVFGDANVVYPSTTTAADGVDAFESIIAHLPRDSFDVIVAGTPNVDGVSLQDLPTVLSQTNKADAKPRIVVVHLHSLSEQLPSIQAILEAASTSTDGHFVAALVPLSTSSVKSSPSAIHHSRRLLAYTSMQTMSLEGLGVGAQAAAGNTTEYIRITPTITNGLAISGFLLFLLLVGVSCMANIQTPSQVPTNPPAVGKEY